MSDDGNDVDPTNPRPKGYYRRFRDPPWYCVNNELAQTFILGSVINAGPGNDWILSLMGENATEMNHGRVRVRLTPRMLHELYTETEDSSPDTRQARHAIECDLCEEDVPLKKTIPNKREEPVRRRYYVDAYGGLVWMENY